LILTTYVNGLDHLNETSILNNGSHFGWRVGLSDIVLKRVTLSPPMRFKKNINSSSVVSVDSIFKIKLW